MSLAAVRRLAARLGVNRAVAFTLLANGWSAASGIVTLLLLAGRMTRDERGFYYTFSGFLNATILLELGLAYVILQFASHERARLEWTPAGLLVGDPSAKARLASLLRMSLRWYGAVAVLIALTVLPAGLVFFGHYTPGGMTVAWRWPWAAVALVGAFSMLLNPVLAVVEGSGRVTEVARLRAASNVASSVTLWLALWLRGGLYAAAVCGLTVLVWGGAWLWHTQRAFLADLLAERSAASVPLSWRGEVWPFQWRIALSGVSSYVIFQMFNPVLFATHGPAAAGRMGLSLSAMGAISALALAWMTTKLPAFGGLIARRDWAGLDSLFFPTLWRSSAVALVCAAAFWGGALGLRRLGLPVGSLLLTPLPLGLLAATSVINHLVGALGLYLRAHKKEPLLGLSLTVAGLVGLSNLLLVRPYGATGMMAGYFAITLLVGLGGGTWLFAQRRREWHTEAAP